MNNNNSIYIENFKELYQKIYNSVKPINYIVDGILILLNIGGFMILIPLLIVSLRTRKWKNQKIDMKLGIWMTVFDIGSAIDSFMNHFFNLINVPWNYPNKLACNINSFVSIIFFFNSIILVGVISLERCLLIVYKKELSDRFYYIICLVQCTLNALICVQTVAMGGFDVSTLGTYCLFDVTTLGGTIGSLLGGALLGFSLFLVFVGYIKICLYRREQSQKAQLELGLDPVKVKKEVNSTIMKSMSIILVSALSNGPYTVILFMQIISNVFLTPTMVAVGTVLINLNQILNAALLCNMKPELWGEVKTMYGFKGTE